MRGSQVVAVHDARHVVPGLGRPQLGSCLIHAGQLTAFAALEERRPTVHLPLVEAVGAPEVGQPLRLPVHLRQQGDAFHELVRGTAPSVEVVREGAGQPPSSMGDQPSTKPIR